MALAITSADLVGVMRGAIELARDYAADRHQYGAPIGSFQAVQHMLADAFVMMEGSHSAALQAAWAVDGLAPADALAAAAGAKAYCSRSARSVCETVIQVHGGIGNTWDCMAHVYLRRALGSIDILGGEGPNLERVLAHRGVPTAERGAEMDFGDSPEEAAFRSRLRDWLAENNPGLPASSTDDEYWAGMAAWHQSLYDAGFFGLSWPHEVGGHGMPSVFDVILDDEIAAAGAPPRPSLGYLVHGIREHASNEVQDRFLPGIVNGRERWCQGFTEPDAGSDLASLRTRADLDGDEYVITGHKVWTSYSDEADWCLLLAPDRPRGRQAQGNHRVRRSDGPARDRAATLAHDQRHHQGVRRGASSTAPGPAADMVGEPGEGWRLAMTVVSHEREPGELGYVARYRKTGQALVATASARPRPLRPHRLSTWPGRSWSPRCCEATSADACPNGWMASSTAPRVRSTSC